MSGTVELSLEKTAEIVSSISRSFFSESSKMEESVFLTTSVVFLKKSPKYIDFSFEALAKLFRQRSSFSQLRVQKHAKSWKFLEKCVFAEYAPLNTLNTVSATLSRSFAERPKQVRCLQKLQNYTSFKKSFLHKLFCWVSRSIFWDSCSKVSAQRRRTDNSMSKKSEKKT